MKTFEELVAKSIEHAEIAERVIVPPAPGTGMYRFEELLAEGQVHATLAEAYARLASAVIVNRTSMHHALEQTQPKGRAS